MEQKNCSNWEARILDQGPEPLIVNIECATQSNSNFRTALWTGKHMQLTLMCIPVGGEIGLEIHEDTDQFIRIESGCAMVQMGCSPNALSKQQRVGDSFAVVVPAGTWHNVVNVGNTPLKVYSLYAPPKHPFGTVHRTKADADREE